MSSRNRTARTPDRRHERIVVAESAREFFHVYLGAGALFAYAAANARLMSAEAWPLLFRTTANRITMQRMSQDLAAAPPSESAKRISREEMIALPIRRYEGPVHILAGQPDLPLAMQDILQESVVGFDTETRPAFIPGESYLPSLVQFATARAVYLWQAQQQELFSAMREIMSSEKIIKVGVSVADDMRNLKRIFEFDERSVVDLGKVAARHGLKQTGVRNLAGIFLGTRIPKGTTTTNWAARRLTSQQITYAATDAWVCRELYLRFTELKMV